MRDKRQYVCHLDVNPDTKVHYVSLTLNVASEFDHPTKRDKKCLPVFVTDQHMAALRDVVISLVDEMHSEVLAVSQHERKYSGYFSEKELQWVRERKEEGEMLDMALSQLDAQRLECWRQMQFERFLAVLPKHTLRGYRFCEAMAHAVKLDMQQRQERLSLARRMLSADRAELQRLERSNAADRARVQRLRTRMRTEMAIHIENVKREEVIIDGLANKVEEFMKHAKTHSLYANMLTQQSKFYNFDKF